MFGNSKMSSRLSFFKSKGPKQFNIYTRYYDPDKEDLDKRVEKAKQEKAYLDSLDDAERVKVSMRKRMDEEWSRNTYSRGSSFANLRLIVIVGVLLYLANYAFNFLDSDLFSNMFKAFTK